MAQHRVPKKQRTRKAVAIGVAAAGLSGALVFGQTTDTTVHRGVTLANAVIGIGGRDDGTSKRLQDKLNGDYALGFTGDPVPITYPANILFQSSIDAADPKVATAIRNAEGDIRISSYSEGTLVAERVKRELAAGTIAAPAGSVDFVFIASPYLPNGGLFARFPGFQVPGLLPVFGPAQATEFDSTYVTNEYDGFADFPAYFNPLSITNAIMGMVYAHPDQYYDDIKLDKLVEGEGKFTYAPDGDNGAGGHDTYILVYNPHLPLLAPIRQFSTLTKLTPLTEPVLGAIEPLLRLMVDMGYTDRTNANPAQPTPFSFITPPKKFVEAVNGVPGALEQGAANVQSGGQPTGTPNLAPTAAQGQRTPAPVDGGASSIVEKKPLTEAAGSGDTTSAQVTKPPAKKPAVADPFKAIAKALRGLGLHPTKTSDGNKASPTTKAGTASGAPDADGAVDAMTPAGGGPTGTTDNGTGDKPAA